MLIETNKQTKKRTKQNKKFLIDSTNKQNKKKNTIVAKTNKHIETDDQEKDKKVKNPRNKKKEKKNQKKKSQPFMRSAVQDHRCSQGLFGP